MKTIIVKKNQTIYDIAAQYYGNCEAVSEIINNNPSLENDHEALTQAEIDTITNDMFYMDIALKQGLQIQIDTDSDRMLDNIIWEVQTDVTTYDHGTDN